jgi:hypothetical protein
MRISLILPANSVFAPRRFSIRQENMGKEDIQIFCAFYVLFLMSEHFNILSRVHTAPSAVAVSAGSSAYGPRHLLQLQSNRNMSFMAQCSKPSVSGFDA